MLVSQGHLSCKHGKRLSASHLQLSEEIDVGIRDTHAPETQGESRYELFRNPIEVEEGVFMGHSRRQILIRVAAESTELASDTI